MLVSWGPRAGRDEKGCLRLRMVRRAALRKSWGRTRLARKGVQYSIQDAVSAQDHGSHPPLTDCIKITRARAVLSPVDTVREQETQKPRQRSLPSGETESRQKKQLTLYGVFLSGQCYGESIN